MKTHATDIKNYYDSIALESESWIKRNSFYHDEIIKLHKFLIPTNQVVLDAGCGTGDLLNALSTRYGLGIDISTNMIQIAKQKYPSLHFIEANIQHMKSNKQFDYIVLSDLIGNLEDVQSTFQTISQYMTNDTRMIVSQYNFLWEPLIYLAELFRIKLHTPVQNWLSNSDIENMLYLSNLEIIKKGSAILCPYRLFGIGKMINSFFAKLPILSRICLIQYFIIRKTNSNKTLIDPSVSIIIPAKNEKGNIESAITRIPTFAKNMEIIFIEGHSSDGTYEEIRRIIKKYNGQKNITLLSQTKSYGKADAVRKGFLKAKGDILMILDADLTTPPEDLPKFYYALRNNKAEFTQGSRLVYSMEKQAMRMLNILGNKFFSLAFTWLLNQPIKDTLCGTKALYKKSYLTILKQRNYFGDFDPFGDFELIFGASKANFKIIEIPIRYKARTYGRTNISRFTHGWLLLKMLCFAAYKLKFI